MNNIYVMTNTKEYNKEYYNEFRDELKENRIRRAKLNKRIKYICECGSELKKESKYLHNRDSKKHNDYVIKRGKYYESLKL